MKAEDITRNKHGGSDTSAAAHAISRNVMSERRKLILDFAKERGAQGITLYDVKDRFGWAVNTFSGIFTKFKATGALVELQREATAIEYEKAARKGKHRPGQTLVYKATRPSPSGAPCAVLVLPQFAYGPKGDLSPDSHSKNGSRPVVAQDNRTRRTGAWGVLTGLRVGDPVEFRINENSEPIEGKVKHFSDALVFIFYSRHGETKSINAITRDVRRVFFDKEVNDES